MKIRGKEEIERNKELRDTQHMRFCNCKTSKVPKPFMSEGL